MKQEIIKDKLPEHIAVIMDGNGRWAKQRGRMRIFGHQNSIKAVRETVEAAAELGIRYLTLYAFSTENWNRPQNEVNALMELLVKTINSETRTLMDNNIRLLSIGDIASMKPGARKELEKAIATTSGNNGTTLILALSYGSRWEITEAVRQIASKVKSGEIHISEIDQKLVIEHLATHNIPDPSLLIRTSGESRISNFLLWQLAYSELYFTPTLWPDFRKEDLYAAILDYQKRERRFGLTSDQLQQPS